MTEILKPKLDFNDEEAVAKALEQFSLQEVPEAAQDSTFSVSDFKSRRADDLEAVFEYKFGESDYYKALRNNVQDFAPDEIVDRLRQDSMTFSGFGTAAMLEKAPQEVKDAYGRILQDWDKTDPEGFENLTALFSNAKHLVQDPVTAATLMIGGPQIPIAAQAAVKREMGKKALQFMASNTRNANMTKAAVAGAGWAGLGNSSEQAVNMAADIQKDFDGIQAATALGTGAVIGAPLGRYSEDIGTAIGKGAARLNERFFRSKIGDDNIKTSVDETVVEHQMVQETGAPLRRDELTLEEAQEGGLEFIDEVEEVLQDIVPSPEKAQSQAKFNAKRAREATNKANKEAQEDRLYGGFVSDSQLDEIAEQYNIDRQNLEEVIFDYEANRDLPNADDFDDYLIEEVGEVFYNLNKSKKSREFAIASFSNYMANRKKSADPVPDNLEKAVEALTIMAQEADRIDLPQAITVKAKAFTAKIGGSEKTEAEVADTLMQVEQGLISPDNARATLLKTTQKYHGKYVFGRPTKVLTKFNESPTAMRLAEMMRYDANQTFTSETKQVGMDFNETWKDYAGTLYSPLIQAMHGLRDISHGGLKDAINLDLSRALRGQKSQSEEVNKAASLIRRNVLNEVVERNKELGFEGDLIDEDYFPRLWNRSVIEKDFYGTTNVFTAEKRNNLAGKGSNRFAKLLVADGEAANIEEANAIIAGMLKKKTDSEGPAGAEFVSGNSFFTSRKFTNIKDDNDYEEFLDNNVENVMFQYITQSSNKYTKRKVFGVDTLERSDLPFDQRQDFNTVYIDKIKAEVEEAGNTFTGQDYKDIQNLYKSMVGEGIEDYGQGGQVARDTYATLVRMSTLPLATVSSLTEILLNIQKAGTKESFKGLGNALAQGTELITNNIRRKLGQQGLSDPEIFNEMRESFLMLENANISAADRLGDSSIAGHGFKQANRRFFQVTLLDGWTKTVQLSAYNTGKSLIHKNLKAIADNGTLPDSKRIGNMRDQLAALNVDVDEGLAYLKRNDGQVNTKDAFYKSVKRGAGRYVNEVVLDTGPRAAIKPIWMSDPKKAIFAELLGYPTAFSNKVLKEFVRGFAKPIDNPEAFANTLAASLSMTAAAVGLNYVRNPDSFNDKSGAEIAAEGVSRWGGAGILLDMVQRTQKTYDITGNPVTAMAGLAGPVGSDIGRAASYGKLGPILGGRMPGYGFLNVLPGETKDQYDKFFSDLEKKEKRLPYRKGGEVEIARASGEPDERIDKITGRPYDSQAGEAFIDEEDRAERKQFVIGGITRAISRELSPFVNELAQTILGETKKNNVKVSQEGAIKVAKNIEEAYSSADPDLPADLDDPDFREFVFTDTKALLNEKHDMSLGDFKEEMPQFMDKDNKLIMGREFSKARGYDDEQIKDFERSTELAEIFAMEGNDVMDVTAHITQELDTIGARALGTNWISKFDNIYKTSAARYDNRIVTSKEVQELIDKFTPEERKLAKKIFSRMPRKALPLDQDGNSVPMDYSIPDEQRLDNLDKFLANSQEKNMVYRSTASGFFNEFDEAVNMPQETGLHVGTKAQAERMALFRREDEDVYDEDSGISSKKISKRLAEPLREGETPPPLAMTRGFVRVEAPLFLKDMSFGTYSNAISFFDSPSTMAAITEAVLAQAPKLNNTKFNNAKQNLYEKVLDFEAWQETVTDGTLSKKKMSEKDLLVERMKIADLNITFRKMLEDQGFDSIKYLNLADTPAEEETINAFSYILFKPEQYKTQNAVEFDPKDPRHNFEHGGRVLTVLKRRKAA